MIVAKGEGTALLNAAFRAEKVNFVYCFLTIV